MPYEPEKDVLIESLLDGGDDGLSVEVRSYSGGPEKIQMIRKVGGRFQKLGRLTIDEAEEVAEAILAYVTKG